MAESTGSPSPDDAALNKRITDYFNSPKGRQHFFEGFISKSEAAKLYEIAKLESQPKSWGYVFPSGQVGLPQGGPSSEEVKFKLKLCKEAGHNWELASDKYAYECKRCGLQRIGPSGAGNWPGATLEEEADEADEADEDDLLLMCLWCGKLCTDHDALDLHEDECAP